MATETKIEASRTKIHWVSIATDHETYRQQPCIFIPEEFLGVSNDCEMRLLRNEKGEIVTIVLNRT